MGSSEASTRRRVKLYMLNDERQWDDKGTGHVSALYTEQDNMALVVISETDGSYLLESKIQPDTAYQKQQETLIVWSEGENMDLALSFQEKVGCDDVWEKICAVQGKDPSVEITQEVIDESDDVDDTDGYTPTMMQSIQPLSLPPCELSRLEEIVDLISQAVASPPKRERLVAFLESTNYLHQLVDVFHKAEDLEDVESLHHLYEIIRQLILVNKHSLYENLFADDMLLDIIGILEYNPSGRTKHRDFLRNKATFKEVLPFHNTDLVTKIHQTYRVQYIQDCCLPPPCLFDEHTLSQLKAFVSINKMEIIRALQEDEEFMCRLFTRLKAADTDLAHRRDLSLFVKEFCNISIQTDQKESFLSCLLQHGALRTAEVLLAIDDRDIKSAALEILQAFIEHQPSVVREYVFRETAPFRKDDELLINLMINQLLTDPDPELSDAFLLGYMLRILIDPDNMNNSGVRSEKTDFLSFFYKRCINTLVRPLFDNTVKDALEKDDYHTALVLNHIIELLTFCIETHTYHMKNYCFNRDLLKRVLILLQSSHKFLVLGKFTHLFNINLLFIFLAALRLLRRVVHMKEEFYNRYLIKNNLFKPVLKLFVSNGYRYNLLDSAIIELFDYIRSEEITSLITHIIENYWDILKNINYVQTFTDLKRTYDHSHRSVRPVVGTVTQQATLDVLSLASTRFQRDPRALEMEEEQWFDQDEDEEEEEDGDNLFPQQSSTLLNRTTNPSAGASESTVGNGPSNISPYGLHTVITTSADLLGIVTSSDTQSSFVSLSSSVASSNSSLDSCASVLPHSSNFSPKSIMDNLTDNLCIPSRSGSLCDRLRLRPHTVLLNDDNESSAARLNFGRQTPIAIHIKSPLCREQTETINDTFEINSRLGPSISTSDASLSNVKNASHINEYECKENVTRSNSSDTQHLSMSCSIMSDISPKTKRNHIDSPVENEDCNLVHVKRLRKSKHSNSRSSQDFHQHNETVNSETSYSDELPHEVNTSRSFEVMESDPLSPIGLVDYSDEESEEEDQAKDKNDHSQFVESQTSDNDVDESHHTIPDVSSSQVVTDVV
ncbi:Serine/threonine-protein phosphatase 4 regulatory subunit 3 isoform 1 [Schistosoma japonicum]|uniref:Serine/threonine-protein phosphatase 4 regulatory subunit 3 isoform 1 n=1 Tax=Schistosoma japonicum TaxID=6182 RepID=A0A4Z2D6A2_SCHJA|nr:Serine/threonine-protein phosphatase 4 regulatory subunit 3 isoform 1 [Schistosoma japonicum]